MSTSAERQRRRRARLRQEGKIDISVSVPYGRRQALREYARQLNDYETVPIPDGRLRKVLSGLKSMRTDLQAAGVQHAGVFGSVARGDDGPESDIDILIHIDHERVKGLLQYIGICADIQASFKEIFPGVDVDVANQETLKPGIRDATERDSIYAF